ncbi:uncharacterized protein STEHIDRAFT_53118 [Stereum hirsutum FP-91666 SS1]|uniref:uncharacterized protein n=1 Tax=Stereum hirsutum (strain FP-91666) TaxID=721885 RepID=UPI000440D3CE|nr:uncharacterized protein STEHIDRAFT_53118 [Stereum hirsutum FP-91666 SS1]EIM89143.1 hypothetical protein STEHIDRAFT_53118 [Stereum hirsutum FP-91666 SS1]
MSHHFNPYVQGWNAGNIPTGQSPWQPGHGPAPSPSIFGALPTMSSYAGNGRPPPASGFQVFRITNLDPNVLNASVVSPQGTSAFRIITDPSQPLRTIWRDSSRRVFATVDWGTRSTVEMPGLFPRQSIRSWLRLSSDRTLRTMELRGVQYIWAPVDNYICLYINQGGSPTQILARVCTTSNGVNIEMTSQGIQHGLVEASVLCASIFLSGHNIE